MWFKKLLSVSVMLGFCLVGVQANNIDDKQLIEDAKSYGLAPIPSNKAALDKLVNEASPDSKLYPTTAKKVELGKRLYFDPRVSKSGLISCNTCHNLGLGGVDGVPAAIGHKWAANPHHLNSPTVYNSVFNAVQFWDGRADHLADQAQGPIQAANEMSADPKTVENRILSIPEYIKEFKAAYGDKVKVDFALIATTIGIFERTLITPSRFDKYLEGDKKALSLEEKKGLRLFIEKGCASCHTGINLGGNMQPFEVAAKYQFASLGDFKGDKDGFIKAPTLRNIALTAPYFHNGAVWDLEEAIKTMGSVQLGINISEENAKVIAVFLESLSGEMPKITYPSFPKSTTKTPRPDVN